MPRRTNAGHLISESSDEAKAELWNAKEKFEVYSETSFPCPDDSHPLFTIRVSKQQPTATCYYCSKTWVLNLDAEED